MEIWPFLDQNRGLTPFGKKVNFSTFWTSCFQCLDRRFFVLEYRKSHFPGLYSLKKKDWKKWPFLDQNQGLTLLEKSQFFVFKTSCFYSLERCFFVLVYRKRHFPGLYCLKKKLEKWSFLDQKHGLTRLKKWPFFDFFNFLFL